MLKLAHMEIFYYVATYHSFSQAAVVLGVSKGYVSHQISALEQELGVKLLHRTTRHLSLTEEGEWFLASCTNITQEKQRAASQLKKLMTEASGHLKITLPASLCQHYLINHLSEFQRRYPNIALTIDASASVKNLLQHNIDIALRLTAQPDENHVARLIGAFRFVVCATPRYLQQHGQPKNPDALAHHNGLIYAADPVQNRWPFQIEPSPIPLAREDAGFNQGKVAMFSTLSRDTHHTFRCDEYKTVVVQGNLTSSDASILKAALLAGQGIARLPQYMVAKDIADERLVVLFEPYTRATTPLYAIYAQSRHIPAKIQRFIHFLQQHPLVGE